MMFTVRNKIILLVLLFLVMLVGLTWNSLTSSRVLNQNIRSISELDIPLMQAANDVSRLLQEQAMEFERGSSEATRARDLKKKNYGTDRIDKSRDRFVELSSTTQNALIATSDVLSRFPDSESKQLLATILQQIDEQQQIYQKNSLETYKKWTALQKISARRFSKKALAAKDQINTLMDQLDLQVKESSKESVDLVAERQQTDDRLMIAASITAVVAGLIAGLLLIRDITRPLLQVVAQAKRMAEGDLRDHSKKSSFRKDEFGQLQLAMDQLTAQLRSVIDGVMGSTNQMEGAAEELEMVTQESEKLIQEQQQQTDHIAQSIHEMNSTAMHASESCTTASTAAKDADEAALSGREVVHTTIDSIKGLSEDIESSAQVIEQLEANSHNISNILNVIAGVAEQTNLLALNAAIEAARAGDHGRGFAVVADEVRQLAMNTQKATQEIEQVIAQLQSGARRATEVMTRSKQNSLDVVKQAAKGESALEAIHEAVSRIRDMNTQISATAEEQSSVSQEVQNNVDSITSIAQRSADSIRNSAKASHTLDDLAHRLSEQVHYFRV
ncbi:methyl-accepting chemotaxis protein [Motiliproteus sp. MSK22-1]|uniref:methyl-accepting chemotaxis protein n=1 Tax=Motiliproteus sp. MSK22-1 TaxID=1897630 RepID=UPI0009F8FC52|nr:methyl-accepting chemotaxis protein [Motiliproteus sp. MSK22-1]